MASTHRHFTSIVVAGLILLSACKDSPSNTGPSGSIALSLSATSGSVVRGNGSQTTLTVTRTDYTGTLNIALEGIVAGTGITGTIGDQQTSGNTTTALISFATTSTASLGTAPITIRVTGTGISDAATSYALTVTAPIVNNAATVDVSLCTFKPIWLAVQDGNGAFTRITPVGDLYHFDVTSSAATLANVTLTSNGGYATNIYTFDRSKWISATMPLCLVPATSMTATIAGMPASTYASIALTGGGSGSRTSNGVMTLNSVRAGTGDIYAFLRGVDATSDRFIFRRAQPITGTGDLGSFDFNGSDAYAAANATISITGLTGTETPGFSMFYHNTIGGKCTVSSLYFRDPPTASFSASGIPSAQQQPTDFHEAFVSGVLPNGDYRGVGQLFHTMAAKTIALPTALPSPVFTYASGSLYRRLQTSVALPSEYAGELLLQVFQNGSPSRTIQFKVQTTNTAGQTIPLVMPDFSGVPGWDPTWGQSTTIGGSWTLYAYNDDNSCTEGARSTFSVRYANY